jgi:hypothetical protein
MIFQLLDGAKMIHVYKNHILNFGMCVCIWCEVLEVEPMIMLGKCPMTELPSCLYLQFES